jgi:hypothetical protein
MSKTRDTGFLGNVVKYDANGNVTVVNGSTTLLNISSSGLLSIPNSEVITGSLTVLGGITGAITGSATSASYAANASLLNGSGSGEFVPTGSFNTFSSSILTYTGSVNSQLSALQTTSGSNITRLSALEVTSGSNITRLSSIEVVTGSNITRLNSLEANTGSYATTGSNTFIGNQTITGSIFGSGSLSINGCITSTGQIVAQTINVQQVTSSIVYSCGSNVFGTTISNTQQLTGSVGITGSLTISGPSSATSYSGTTIYGSTAVCSPVGKFTSCIDAGSVTASNVLLRSADSAAVVDVLTLYNPSSTSSGVRQKYQNGYGDLAAIKVSQRDNGTLADDGQIEFQVASNSVLDTKLTILNTGVATFSGNVNVYDGSSRGLTISNSSGAITFSNNWGKTTFTAPSAQDIEFNDDAGIRRLFLKNGGNVGIGTCTAAAKLEIEAGRNCTLLRLTAASGENWDIKNTNTVGSTDVLSIGAAGATANLNLKDDGSVGVGTCSPSGLFQVGVCNSGIYFDTSLQYTPKIIAAGTISDIQIQSVGNGGNVYLNAPGTTSLINFQVNGAERMRITNGGNVLIGTTCIYNTANFIVSAGSGPTSSPYMGIFNCTSSPTNDASVRLDLGFLGGSSNYVATGGCLGAINFMGQGNDAGYGGSSIQSIITCGGNTCRFNHAVDMAFFTKPTGQTGALERMRITSGGTIFNKQWFGATLMGGYSLIGTIGPGNVGDRYLHARINTIGSMMVWIKIFGYSYAGGILEGIGGGYVDGGTGTIAQNYNNGSIPIIHQNGGYIEVVVDTIQSGTTNRWGSISFIGGTDTIATVQPLEIMTWSWTSATTRVY